MSFIIQTQIKDIFGDRLYFALSNPAQVIPDFARPVAVHPIYYLHPKHASLQRTLTAIRLNQTVESVPIRSEMHFPSPQELERKFVTQLQEKSGVPIETGKRVWEMMAAFEGYGFPKAHAEIGVVQEDVEVFQQDLLGVVLEISPGAGDYRLRGGDRIHVAGQPISTRTFHDICHMTRDRKICIVGIPALEK